MFLFTSSFWSWIGKGKRQQIVQVYIGAKEQDKVLNESLLCSSLLLYYPAFVQEFLLLINIDENEPDNNIEIVISEVRLDGNGYRITYSVKDSENKTIVIPDENYQKIVSSSKESSPTSVQYSSKKRFYTANIKVHQILSEKVGQLKFFSDLDKLTADERKLATGWGIFNFLRPYLTKYGEKKKEISTLRENYIKTSKDPILAQLWNDLCIIESSSLRREDLDKVKNLKDMIIEVFAGEKTRFHVLDQLNSLLNNGLIRDESLKAILQTRKIALQEDNSKVFIELNFSKESTFSLLSSFTNTNRFENLQLFFGTNAGEFNLDQVIVAAKAFLKSKVFEDNEYNEKDKILKLFNRLFCQCMNDTNSFIELQNEIVGLQQQTVKAEQQRILQGKTDEILALIRQEKFSRDDIENISNKLQENTQLDEEINGKNHRYEAIDQVAEWLIGQLNKIVAGKTTHNLFAELINSDENVGISILQEEKRDLFLNKDLLECINLHSTKNSDMQIAFTTACWGWLENQANIDALLQACEALEKKGFLPLLLPNVIPACLFDRGKLAITTLQNFAKKAVSANEEVASELSELTTKAVPELNKIIDKLNRMEIEQESEDSKEGENRKENWASKEKENAQREEDEVGKGKEKLNKENEVARKISEVEKEEGNEVEKEKDSEKNQSKNSKKLQKLRKEQFEQFLNSIRVVLIQERDDKAKIIMNYQLIIESLRDNAPDLSEDANNFLSALEQIKDYEEFKKKFVNLIAFVKSNNPVTIDDIKNAKALSSLSLLFTPENRDTIKDSLAKNVTGTSHLLNQILQHLADFFKNERLTVNIEGVIDEFINAIKDKIESQNIFPFDDITPQDIAAINEFGNKQQKVAIIKLAIDFKSEDKGKKIITEREETKKSEENDPRKVRAQLRRKIDKMIKEGHHEDALKLAKLFQLQNYGSVKEENVTPKKKRRPSRTKPVPKISENGEESTSLPLSDNSPPPEPMRENTQFSPSTKRKKEAVFYVEIINKYKQIDEIVTTLFEAYRNEQWTEENTKQLGQLNELFKQINLELLNNATVEKIEFLVITQLERFKTLFNESRKAVEEGKENTDVNVFLISPELIKICREMAEFYKWCCLEEFNTWFLEELTTAYYKICEFLTEENLSNISRQNNEFNKIGGDIGKKKKLENEFKVTKFYIQWIMQFGTPKMKQALITKFGIYKEFYLQHQLRLLASSSKENSQYKYAISVFEIDSVAEAEKLLLELPEKFNRACVEFSLTQSLRNKVILQYEALINQILSEIEKYVTDKSKDDFTKLRQSMITGVNEFTLDQELIKSMLENIAKTYGENQKSWLSRKASHEEYFDLLNSYLRILQSIMDKIARIVELKDNELLIEDFLTIVSGELISLSKRDESTNPIKEILNQLEKLDEEKKLIKESEDNSSCKGSNELKHVFSVKEQYCLLKMNQIKKLKNTISVAEELAMAEEVSFILNQFDFLSLEYDKSLADIREIIATCKTKLKVEEFLTSYSSLKPLEFEIELEKIKGNLSSLSITEPEWVTKTMDEFFKTETKKEKEGMLSFQSNFKKGKAGHTIALFVRDELKLELASNPLSNSPTSVGTWFAQARSNVVKASGNVVNVLSREASPTKPSSNPDSSTAGSGGSTDREFTSFNF